METNQKQLSRTTNARATTTKTLAESAILVALATVLSIYAVFKLPSGGAATIGSMVPIMLVSLKYPLSWSLTVSFAFSMIKILLGFYAPPVGTVFNYALVILLDYVVAFSVLCLAGPITRALRQDWSIRIRMVIATVSCLLLRFFCHFLSGIIIWGVYAPAGQPVWLYSLLYNGSYMLCEILVSGLIMYFAGPKLAALFVKGKD
ncbi:MAG: energy-coupled thiamine transporter ThiT [Clostridiales bacterium]|nr:energy-coupled thiamine transporter ThiT [Clostridiales bacterium]